MGLIALNRDGISPALRYSYKVYAPLVLLLEILVSRRLPSILRFRRIGATDPFFHHAKSVVLGKPLSPFTVENVERENVTSCVVANRALICAHLNT